MKVQPKFTVGETVYFPYYTMVKVPSQCPDCLDERVWTVTTPARETFKMTCGTCCPYTASPINAPTSMEFRAMIRGLTVGSVGYEHDGTTERYRYMARETGIGTGTVYDEVDLTADPESALRIANFRAVEAKRKYDARVEAQREQQKRRARRKPCKVCGRV